LAPAGPFTFARATAYDRTVRVGESIESPTLGLQVTWRELGPEVLTFDLRMRGDGPAIPLHVHPRQQERITVVSGAVRSRSGPRDSVLHPGEAVVTPPGEPHTIAPAHGQDAEVIAELSPALAYGEFMERSFALDRAGHVNRKGRSNPLRMATLGMAEAEFFMAHVPISLQRTVTHACKRLGRALGYDQP
jgi:mannose-6-phosphate isomerase-like protein (cupin superfamily)